VRLDERTPKGIMIPQLALHILEGLTPPGHEVTLVEEETARLDPDGDWDLVGISCLTSNAPRGYALADHFRRKGASVVLGGVHPTILPDEALLHADAVAIGEAEGVWTRIVDDVVRGTLKRRYHCPEPDLKRYVPKPHLHNGEKRLFNAIPLATTRGCPYGCDFCCVGDIYGKKIRHIPVENVVRDIESTGGKTFVFLDDNIIARPKYAKDLFRAIRSLGIRWVGQASISFVHDRELMRLARESGCSGLFFGLESVSESRLKQMRKSIKDLRGIEEAVKKVRGLGIHFHASMVFGFDDDTLATFPETVEFLQRNKIGTVSFNILTPYPGTVLYDQYKREGRLLTTDWRYFDHSTVVFRPRNMTPSELQSGTMWARREFTKISSVLKRLPGNLRHPFLFFAMNHGIRCGVYQDRGRLAALEETLFRPERKDPFEVGLDLGSDPDPAREKAVS